MASQPAKNGSGTSLPANTRVVNPVQAGAPGVSLEETVESSIEKMVKDYGPPVAMAVLVIILGLSAWAYVVSRGQITASNQWDSINIGVHSSSVATLQATADSSPGTLIGAVATQNAGMVELNGALAKMVRDKDKAKQEIEAAAKRFEQVLASPQSSEMLKQQATFSLAFAKESLGDFAGALALYKELADTKDHPFERMAKDGVQRCEDPTMKAFYTAFSEWKPTDGGTAPGDTLEGILNSGGSGALPPINLDPGQKLDLDSLPPVPPLDNSQSQEGESAGETSGGDQSATGETSGDVGTSGSDEGATESASESASGAEAAGGTSSEQTGEEQAGGN